MKKTIVYADKVNFFYTHFKKHCCPECGRRVQTRYIDKSVNSNSPEAKNMIFRILKAKSQTTPERTWFE